MRESAGRAISDVARDAGMSPDHVARIERGEKREPQFRTVARLADVLGVSLDVLAVAIGIRAPARPTRDAEIVRVTDQLSADLAELRHVLGRGPNRRNGPR